MDNICVYAINHAIPRLSWMASQYLIGIPLLQYLYKFYMYMYKFNDPTYKQTYDIMKG